MRAVLYAIGRGHKLPNCDPCFDDRGDHESVGQHVKNSITLLQNVLASCCATPFCGAKGDNGGRARPFARWVPTIPERGPRSATRRLLKN